MFTFFKKWLVRHPVARDAILWALPAIFLGAILRLMMLKFSPYAYFGSDSKSFYGFAYTFLDSFDISLNEKRRYIYPIFLLPLSALPGSPLKWIAWTQHVLGLLTLIPLAYIVRATMVQWRGLVVPVTAFYGCMPMIFWYEHEVIGETVFFNALIFAMAGWMAWMGNRTTLRGPKLFWIFFASFAVLMLTKPSARFFIPGLLIGLVGVAAWKYLNRKHALAAVALFGLSATVGQESQGAWLLYFSSFPLTQLETPLHAEYKAEVRELVTKMRTNISSYGVRGDYIFEFLDSPDEYPEYPKFGELAKDDELRTKIYNDLAKEGIKAHPFLFLYISLQRLAMSANPSEFKEKRWLPDYYPEKFETVWKETERKPEYINFLFGLPKDAPRTSYEEVSKLLAPESGRAAGDWLHRYVLRFHALTAIVEVPERVTKEERHLTQFGLTKLGWWMMLGALLTLLPVYWRTLGVWTVCVGGYLVGVFLVGGDNARYFGAAWAMMTIWLVVPIDAARRAAMRFMSPR